MAAVSWRRASRSGVQGGTMSAFPKPLPAVVPAAPRIAGATAAAAPAAAALPPPKPADWTSDGIQKQTDGEIFWKISNGRGSMPPWKHLPEKERWEIVNFIRSLKKKQRRDRKSV